MRDPIDELSNFDPGADMSPPPPSEIRRRGDRLRRRNQVLAGVGAAAAVALIATPLALLGDGRSADDGPDPAPPSDTLSEANLMTDAETEFHGDPGGFDWTTRDTTQGDGQAAFSPCARQGLGDLGAATVVQRDFDFTDGTTTDDTNTLVQVAGEFPDEASATRAYETTAGWLQDCSPPGADEYDAGEPQPVQVAVDGRAQVVLSTYRPVPEEIDPRGDEVWFLETGLVVSGDRVTVITQRTHGQDYNWPQGGTPMERMLPPAADRLVNGATAEDDEEPPAAVTQIPDSFPLTSAMPDGSGEGEAFEGPGRDVEPMAVTGVDLNACGSSPAEADSTDRLTTRITGPANGHSRELQLFADDAAAASSVDTLRSHYEACPEDSQNGSPPIVTTTVRDGAIGEESVDIRRTFQGGGGRVAITVVRVGNAVLVENISDEGSDVDALATMARENLADVVTAMSDLVDGQQSTDGSTDPASGPKGDAWGQEIPGSFPLAAGWPAADGDTTVRGPNRALPSLEHTACGQTLEEGIPHTDRMRAERQMPEDFRARQLSVYADAGDAVAAVSEIVAFYRGCPADEADTAGYQRHHDVRRTAVGGESWAIVGTTTFEGAPAVGLDIDHVIRLGRAVLVVSASNEGGAGPNPQAQIQRQIDRMTQDAAEPIAAMCRFTEAGC